MDIAENAKYDPEYVWSYECGMKTNWLDNRIILNIAGFYTKIKDMQVAHMTDVVGMLEYTNAEGATIKGFEVEFMARPLKGLDIMASFGFLDTEFDDNKDPYNFSGPQDYTGNKTPFSPEYVANFTVLYRAPWGIYVRGESNWIGKVYFNEANTDKQSAYNHINAKIGYDIEHVDINSFVNNIFDKEYYSFIRDGITDPTQKIGMIGDPRTFGAQASAQF